MDAAHKRWWPISEVVFGLPFLLGVALQLAAPLAFPAGWLTLIVRLGGLPLVAVGLAFIVSARREFGQRAQPTDPGHPTTAVVTTGAFAFSRNPIYLGATCLLLGIALAANWPWAAALIVPAVVACHYVLIVPEEQYLAAKFGDAYLSYVACVHRWLGCARRQE